MKTINAEELKDYINHLIDKRKKIGTPDYDVYTILGYVVQKMEDEPEKGLDEQIERIASDIAPKYPDVCWDDCYDKIVEGIKAGMRLQTSRGYTFEYKIKGRNTIEQIDMDELARKGILWNDDIIIQIRKKNDRFYPKDRFDSYEEYEKYLKEKGYAIEVSK